MLGGMLTRFPLCGFSLSIFCNYYRSDMLGGILGLCSIRCKRVTDGRLRARLLQASI